MFPVALSVFRLCSPSSISWGIVSGGQEYCPLSTQGVAAAGHLKPLPCFLLGFLVRVCYVGKKGNPQQNKETIGLKSLLVNQ